MCILMLGWKSSQREGKRIEDFCCFSLVGIFLLMVCQHNSRYWAIFFQEHLERWWRQWFVCGFLDVQVIFFSCVFKSFHNIINLSNGKSVSLVMIHSRISISPLLSGLINMQLLPTISLRYLAEKYWGLTNQSVSLYYIEISLSFFNS